MGADQFWHYQALLTVFFVGCFLGGLSIGLLPCLVTGHYLIKKIKTWPKFRVVTAPGLKFRVVSRPPCPRLAARMGADILQHLPPSLHPSPTSLPPSPTSLPPLPPIPSLPSLPTPLSPHPLFLPSVILAIFFLYLSDARY